MNLRRGWPIVAACFFGIWTAYMIGFMLGPMLDDMARDMDRSLSSMGQLAALTFLPWAFSAPLMGPVSDRYGRKAILLIGLAGLCILNLTAASSGGYATLAVCRFLTGVCGGFVPPSCVSLIGDLFSGKDRGYAFGIAIAGNSAAILLGLPTLAYLTDILGWRGGFTGAALFAGAVFALAAFTIPKSRKNTGFSSYLGSFGWLRSRPARYTLAANVLERFVITLFLTYVSAFLLRRYGVSLSSVAGLLTAMSAGMLIGALAGGPMVNLKRRYMALVLILLAEGVLLGGSFGLEPPLMVAVGAGFLFSVASSFSRPTVADTFSAIAPANRGTAIGFYAASNQVGQVLGASGGALALAWGGFAALGALGLIGGIGGGAFFFLLMREMRAREESPGQT